MKTRLGFVSNSSAASFILQKDSIGEDLLAQVRRMMDDCGWDWREDADVIEGFTTIDNDDVGEWLEAFFLQNAITPRHLSHEHAGFCGVPIDLEERVSGRPYVAKKVRREVMKEHESE